MKMKDSRYYDNDNIDILNTVICQYLKDAFIDMPLELRLKKCYSKDIIKINPAYSFIIVPDENFLNKP